MVVLNELLNGVCAIPNTSSLLNNYNNSNSCNSNNEGEGVSKKSKRIIK